ncbi:hypothetical protein ACOBR2_14080 [Telmatobacter bradus]|uniref:hypothetical protein n=1 Tax=Telmatobacter bradus TaxID=474953 RepID=UPI003B43BA58
MRPYLGRSVVLDTNLLLLHLRCTFDFSLLTSFKRLGMFDSCDYLLLAELLKVFPSWFTTPHVLTEVSNLANSLPDWRKTAWSEFFSQRVQVIPELYEESAKIASDSPAIRFGLTDAALSSVANQYLVMTVDWPLTGFLESRSLPVLNMVHLKGIEFAL